MNDAVLLNRGQVDWLGANDIVLSGDSNIRNDGTDGEGRFLVHVGQTIFGQNMAGPALEFLSGAELRKVGGDITTVEGMIRNFNSKVDLGGRSLSALGGYAATDAVTLLGGGTLFIANEFVQAGAASSTNLGGGTLRADGMTLHGTLTLDGGTIDVGAWVLTNAGIITGSGSIRGNVSNAGTIEVGGAGALGSLTVTGNYTQAAGGTLRVDAAGGIGGSCDRLSVSGDVTLDGSDGAVSKTLLDQPALIKPGSDSAYWPALDNVTTLAAPGGPGPSGARSAPDLQFLNPPADGSSLGSLSHFNVRRVIGRGGIGIVLQATDTYLERDVAIKVLDPELAGDELARKRFCREARAAASLSHENVVAVHQVEHEEGKDLPFLVMELVRGESLESKLKRDRRLPLRDIVCIGMQTAAGLAAAHQKGLIHRDIKPGNILLEQAGQRVKLSDFGLARAAEDLRLTRSGLVAGTPLYMSPEQASGEDLDARSDLFSLGVVLYELAAGEPPFTGKTPLAVLKRLTESQPVPLREHNADLPEWFVEIVEKLLAKDPKDRFQSAREVADTLEHYWSLLRSSETVMCPKKRTANLAQSIGLGVAAGVLTLLLGVGAALVFLPSRDRADHKVPTPFRTFKGTAGPLWSMGITADGKNLALGSDDGTVRYWDVAGERVLWTLNAHDAPIWALALSPRGDYLATGSDDGQAKIWEVATQKVHRTLPKIGGVRALAFDAGGRRLLTGGRDGSVKAWSTEGGEALLTTAGHGGLVSAVAFSPDGSTLASASSDKTVKVWDARTGQLKFTLAGHESGVYALAYSPTDPFLVSGSWDRTVRLWDLNAGGQLAKFDGHAQAVWSVAFDPDGVFVASTGEDQLIRFWDIATKKEAFSFRAAVGTVLNVRFSSESPLLIGGAKDGTARMWNWRDLQHGR